MASTLDALKSSLPIPTASDKQYQDEFDNYSSDDPDALVSELATNPGLNPTHFDAGARYEDDEDEATRSEKAKRMVKAVAHPMRSIKNHSNKKTAAKIAASRPVVPKANDREFLQAQRRVEGRDNKDEVGDREDSDAAGRNKDENNSDRQDDDVERLNELMGERDNLRVAWTMDEGVMRAIAVDRKKRTLPTIREFEKIDGDGNKEIQWMDFIGRYILLASWPYTSLYVDEFSQIPFETDIIRRHVHRLLICSAPLQKWIIQLRSVYRWENPYHTLRWMIVLAFLIAIDHVASFFLGWIIWHVIRNGAYPSRPTESKDAIERKLDSEIAPTTVAELIDQCNQEDWLLPLLDMIGPALQLQLNDAADVLEILDNFYQWKSPIATIRTIALLLGVLIVFNIFSVSFMLRCTYTMASLIFFAFWPISSLYPQYRLLVSPIRWAFWGVPTHALWSISELQVHAAHVKRGFCEKAEKAEKSREEGYDVRVPGAQCLPLIDLARFSCILHSESRHPGSLIISTAGIRFQGVGKASKSEKAAFDIPYPRLVEICKKQAKEKQVMPVNIVTKLLNSLEIVFKVNDADAVGYRKVVLENFRERDRAFNLILGFSELEWKTLQPYTDE